MNDYQRARRIRAHVRVGMTAFPPRPRPVDPDLIAWQDAGEVGDFEAYKARLVRERTEAAQRACEDTTRQLREDAEAFAKYERGEGPLPKVWF